jgi:hypothetical protein
VLGQALTFCIGKITMPQAASDVMEKRTTLDIFSKGENRPTPATPKPVLWKWSLAITIAVLLFLMWQCGSALHEGLGLSNNSVREFHQRLNGGKYEDIYQKADESFTEAGKHDELVTFLKVVHARLGNAGVETLANMRVNATTGGTFIVAQYNTTFEGGPAVETFTWIKSNRTLKLYEYHIQSNAIIQQPSAPKIPTRGDLLPNR